MICVLTIALLFGLAVIFNSSRGVWLNFEFSADLPHVPQQPSPSPTPRIDSGARPQSMERHATLPAANGVRRVVFTSERDGRPQIYSINLDGTGERRLTDLKALDMAPDSTRDGKWIAFLSLADQKSPATIGLMRSDGSQRKGVPISKDVRWPRISPNGKRLVFTAANDQRASTIFIVNADGTDLKPFPSGLAQAWDPAWSADGKKIAFSVYPADFKHLDTMTNIVYVADADGSHRRLLATFTGFIQLPRWSPDGRFLAYQTYTGDADANLILIDATSGEVKKITHHDHPYRDEAPAWLPDGRLLFQSDRSGKFEVWMMNADGTHQQQITGRSTTSVR